jgi:serine phosphatase RsbU (regulator of sigma subunit)
VEDIGRIVKRSVEDFAGDAPQFDDITMMVIKYKADKEGKEEIK